MKMKYWKKEARAGAFCGQRLKKTKEQVVLLCGGSGESIGWFWSVGQRYIFTAGKLVHSLNILTKMEHLVSEQQLGYCFFIF